MKGAILLLGAGGFVGSALTRALREANVPLVAVGHHLVPSKGDVTTVDDTFERTEQFARWLPKCRAVVHLASASTPGSSAGKPLQELATNLRATLALLQALQDHPDCELLYLSSGGTLYGDAGTQPASEHHIIRPKSYYGAGKAAAEHFISAWTAQFSARATILRPSNLYGPGQTIRKGFGIIPTAFDAAAKGTPLPIWGDGSTIRDYLYIDDFVRLCLDILARPMLPGTQIMNAASGHGVSLNELLTQIETVTGKTVTRHYQSGRSVDVSRIVLSPERAQRHYGWAATTTLADGLERTWAWHSAQ